MIVVDISGATKRLGGVYRKYEQLVSIFNAFQKHILHIKDDSFPIKNIKINTEGNETSVITFIDREYKITFCSCFVDGYIKGKILFDRILATDKELEVGYLTYDANGSVDIRPQEIEIIMNLCDEISCIELVLSWIIEDINRG